MQIYWNSRERLHKKKKLNYDRTGMGHQHGRHFIVLGHQYGRRDVMWNTLYLGYYSIYHEHLLEDILFTTQ